MNPSGQGQRGGAGGEKPPARTDIVIAQNVRDVLAASGLINLANVSVECNNGVVALDGVVPSLDKRTIAENIARSVPDVCDVVNRIVVAEAAGSPLGRRSDKAISHNEPDEP